MPYCSILQCKNDSRKNNLSNGGISYHRFPKDASVKEKWIDATGRDNWMPTKLSTICSEHFLVADFVVSDKGYRFIKPTALPTLKILNFFKHKSNDDNKMTCVQTDLGGGIVQLERKAVKNLDTLVSSSRSTPRKNKLKGRVRFCIEKIKKQSIKIKALQTTNRRLKKKLKNIDEILTKLEEKFAVAKEDLNRHKNTNINYILIK